MEALFIVFFMLGFTALLFFVFAINKGHYGSQVANLRGFQDRHLTGGRLLTDEGWFPDLEATSLTGKLDGRSVSVGFRVVGSGKHKKTYTTFTVTVPNAVPRFKVEPAGVIKRLGRFLGLVKDVSTGNQDVDDKYILSGRRGSLRQLFHSGRMERAIDEVFGVANVTSLELTGRRLRVEVFGVTTGPPTLVRMFDRMVTVAEQCGRKQVQVKVLGEVPKLAITAGTDHAVCPFCRDAVALDGDDVMACEGCNTVHHTECYAEAGGCTIYGCKRQRVRA